LNVQFLTLAYVIIDVAVLLQYMLLVYFFAQ
jgi:hypothetical protein